MDQFIQRPGKKPKTAIPKITYFAGHISRRIMLNQDYPNMPGTRRFTQNRWLPLLISRITLDMRSYLSRWHLLGLITHAKHFQDVHYDWAVIGALVEIWHPITHTFLFPTFEAIVLLEETEMLLGLKRMKSGNKEKMATMIQPIGVTEFLTGLIPNPNIVSQIRMIKGLNLMKLASWVYKQLGHAQEEDMENVMKAFVICLAGALLFPSTEDFLEEEHLSTISAIWEGKRIGPAVLAYLYSGLTLAALGRPLHGSILLLTCWVDLHLKFDPCDESQQASRIFSKSPLHYMTGVLGLSDRVINRVPKLEKRADWREHFKIMPRDMFTCASGFLKTHDLCARLSPGVELRLIDSMDFFLYNVHRCLPQLGLPRHHMEDPSHLPPIKKRVLLNQEDEEEVNTIKALWKVNKLYTPLEHVKEDGEMRGLYVRKLREMRA